MGEHYFGATDKGQVRDNNEDTFLVQETSGGSSVIACVIDGVGGYEGGEVAAATARDSIAEHLTASPSDGPGGLRDALLLANARIIEQKAAHRGGDRMACVLTLALADLGKNVVHYAHVGDTRMYLLRGTSLVKVTKDHSFVGFLEDSSRLTEENAMRHPKRNEVNKALGFDPNIGKQADYIETGTSPFLPGDLLLLCSDGLTDMIGSTEITDVLTGAGTLPDKAKALLDAANGAGGRDNITVVLVLNNKPRAAQEPAPVARKSEPSPAATSATPSAAIATSPSASTTTRSTNARPEATREAPLLPKKTSPLVFILAIACVALAAALAWALMRKSNAPAAPTEDEKLAALSTPAAPAKPARTPEEQRLRDGITSSTGAYALDTTAARTPITLTDSIFIQKETLHLDGGGLVLRGTPGMTAPALVFSDSVDFVFLENMVFENFPVAIQARAGVLQMANVRFVGCATSVTFNLRATDSIPVGGYVNGATLYNPVASFTKGGSAR